MTHCDDLFNLLYKDQKIDLDEYFLEHKDEDINTNKEGFNSFLIGLVSERKVDALEMVLEYKSKNVECQNRSEINKENVDGYILLDVALMNVHQYTIFFDTLYRQVEIILKNFDISVCGNIIEKDFDNPTLDGICYGGKHYLEEAIKSEDVTLVRLYLEYGNRKNIEDNINNKCIELNPQRKNNISILSMACTGRGGGINGNIEIAKELINHGASCNNTGRHNLLTEVDDLEICQLLINNGIKINKGDNVYNSFLSPLFYACRDNNLEKVEFLLRNGADKSPTAEYNIDMYGKSILDLKLSDEIRAMLTPQLVKGTPHLFESI